MSSDLNNSSAQPVAVIMAGGAGTRFWPVSRAQRPKQFLNLIGKDSLLQSCLKRLEGVIPVERVLVMTSREFIPLVREQLPEIPPEHIIGEPCRRDTAAAVALAALLARRIYGDCTLVTLASDPHIAPTNCFQETLRSAIKGAQQSPQALYTIGIAPTFPSVAYGYLHRGERLQEFADLPHYRLQGFREKPNKLTAEEYLESGEYYWNSGMFIWQSQAILEELRLNLPEHLQRLEPAIQTYGTPEWEQVLATQFDKLRKISIDFAVMEKARDIRTVEANFEWFDVGSWQALEPFLPSDGQDNRRRGAMVSFDAHRNIVFNEDSQETIALVGVDDLVVVHSGKHTLVVARDRLEDVKKLVAQLPTEEQ